MLVTIFARSVLNLKTENILCTLTYKFQSIYDCGNFLVLPAKLMKTCMVLSYGKPELFSQIQQYRIRWKKDTY